MLRCACLNPAEHYDLDVGLLRKGDSADFILVDNLKDLHVKATFIRGQTVAQDGQSLIGRIPIDIINHFTCSPKPLSDFAVKAESPEINVIQIVPNELITNKIVMPAKIEDGHLIADPSRDLLKLVVVNRYENVKPAVAFVKGFGFTKGAIASKCSA